MATKHEWFESVSDLIVETSIRRGYSYKVEQHSFIILIPENLTVRYSFNDNKMTFNIDKTIKNLTSVYKELTVDIEQGYSIIKITKSKLLSDVDTYRLIAPQFVSYEDLSLYSKDICNKVLELILSNR